MKIYPEYRGLGQSFGCALRGIRQFMRTERNAGWHLLATLLVIAASLFLKISPQEAMALALAIGLVWVAELLNTCLEKLLDFTSRERDPRIAYIKDLAAGAVLMAAGSALVTGLFIFIPKII